MLLLGLLVARQMCELTGGFARLGSRRNVTTTRWLSNGKAGAYGISQIATRPAQVALEARLPRCGIGARSSGFFGSRLSVGCHVACALQPKGETTYLTPQ